MKYKAHDYQAYATNFILEHPISAVFLDMGLGKSIITLSAIFDLCLDSFLVRKVLVIAPLRVARDTWPAEIHKWDHLHGLTYSVAVGTEGERKAALRQRVSVYIINRENVQWLIEESGIPFDYDMVVIDELSSFKSYQAKRFRTLLKVRPGIKRIVGLTGTPSSNTYTALMDGRKANLVITDPPYNVNYEGSAGKIKNDNMASEKFFDFLFDAFSNMEKVMADDASIYVFHADTEGLNFRKAFDAAGFYLSGCCIWKKQSLVLGRSPYQWQHEPCLYGWKKKGKHQWYTGRKESTIWEFDKPKKNGDHPTMKPIPLLAYPIQNSSMANSVVLDPFGGSGSTLIACEQTDRICCTIELDEKFCDVIVRRYIEQVDTDEKVSVLRDGKEYKYSEIANTAAEV